MILFQCIAMLSNTLWLSHVLCNYLTCRLTLDYLQLLERFGNNWPSARVRRYLQQQDGSVSSTETEGRPWGNLLPLLRKYPDDFVLSSVTRGEVTTEYVGLVSLVSLGNGP